MTGGREKGLCHSFYWKFNMKIQEMSIDLETYSDVDIKKGGVYKYAESDNFEILLFAVSINNGPVVVYDIACGDILPNDVIDALVDDSVTKWAFNAVFERVCISYWLKKHYPDKFKATAYQRTLFLIILIRPLGAAQ